MNTRDTAVCVDTGVLTSALRLGSLLETRYRRHLTGRRLVIATQVVAEARYGALRAGWGDRRLADLERLLGSALVLVPDDLTASTFARVRLACERIGHPLHQKVHTGDLWIAATATRWGLPLVSDDRVFEECPELTLVREPQ
ncbi:MAG: PIN domain-containing protein [Ilumatobacteraceae bacterium]|nr:PIN domain-containing protein [Actinomycetota bacterium]MCO5329732.1 PIN domain-containing protein [Ilumatobacteraceae bacterium]